MFSIQTHQIRQLGQPPFELRRSTLPPRANQLSHAGLHSRVSPINMQHPLGISKYSLLRNIFHVLWVLMVTIINMRIRLWNSCSLVWFRHQNELVWLKKDPCLCCQISQEKQAASSVETSPKEATWLSENQTNRMRERPLDQSYGRNAPQTWLFQKHCNLLFYIFLFNSKKVNLLVNKKKWGMNRWINENKQKK